MADKRRYPRLYTELRLVVRQDMQVESSTTRTVGLGGLSFKTQFGWRIDAPIAVSIVEPERRLELLARVVDSRPGLCSVEFRPGRRGHPPDLAALGPQLDQRLQRLDRVQRMRVPVLLRLPTEELSWFSFRFKRVALTGLDSLGGFVLSRLRPRIGVPAILAMRQRRGQPVVKVEGEVVRHGETGFGIEFTGDSERRRSFYRALNGR